MRNLSQSLLAEAAVAGGVGGEGGVEVGGGEVGPVFVDVGQLGVGEIIERG